MKRYFVCMEDLAQTSETFLLSRKYHDQQKFLIQECKRNIIYSDKPNKLFAMRGIEDCIIIDTKDVLMICPRDVDKLKEFLSRLAMPEFEAFR